MSLTLAAMLCVAATAVSLRGPIADETRADTPPAPFVAVPARANLTANPPIAAPIAANGAANEAPASTPPIPDERVRDETPQSARRRAEAKLLLTRTPLNDETLTPGSPLCRELARLAPESSEALADVVTAARGRRMLDERLAAALVRRPVTDTFDALATLWLDDATAPSAVLRAAMLLEATSRASNLDAAAARAAERLLSERRMVDAPRRRSRVALVAAFQGADAETFLYAAARDPDAGVRVEAARALARHLPARAAETLAALAADRSADVRVAALEGFAHVPGAPCPGPAILGATDSVTAVRRAAATLLGRDATPSEIPLLVALSEDENASVRAAARAARRAVTCQRWSPAGSSRRLSQD